MEKNHSDTKRKPAASDEEPPDKKICHGLSIEDILPPSEDRNKDLSTHSIQHVVGSCSTSKVDLSEDPDGPRAAPTGEPTNGTSDQDSSKQVPPDTDKDGSISQSEPHQQDDEPTPPAPSSSVEEVAGIRIPSNVIHTSDSDDPPECSSKDDSGKKIKWKCESHFSDQGTHPIGTDTLTSPRANTDDPQTSTSSVPARRNQCFYGPKCYRKNSGHKAEFSHPGDSDYDVKDDRPECRYGVKCYRKDPKHKSDFKHTVMRRKRAQTPVRTRMPETYESGSDQSSAEESVDESEYDPSVFDESSDDDENDW